MNEHKGMKKSVLLLGVFCLLILIVTVYEVMIMSDENYQEYLDRDSSQILQDINYTTFSKMDEVAKVLAKDNNIKQLCLQNDTVNYNTVKIEINTVQKAFGLDICYILDSKGMVIAASDYSKDESLKIEGLNYGFRPYFSDAINGEDVIYPALGSTTNARGIYFSSPVKNAENNVIGVVVCKINMEVMDKILTGYSYLSAITTSDGIVFSTSHKDWLYKSTMPLSEQKLNSILRTNQFLNIPIEPIGLSINNGNANLHSKKYFISQKNIGSTGWTLLTMMEYNTNPLLSLIQKRFITIISLILTALLITIAILINNILKRHEAEAMHKKLFLAVQESSSIVVITDADGVIDYINPKFTEITGYLPQECIGKNTNILKSEQHGNEFYGKMWNTIMSGEDWRGTFCNKRKNGEIYWEDTHISSVKDNKGRITNFIAIKEDITKRREMDEMLNKYATMDEMTGTFNRRSGISLMEKQLQLSRRQNQNFVIFFMDINGLKSVNDTLGHSFGDELITLAVSVIKECLREVDSICRLGGDEFLLIFPMMNLTQADIVLQRIHDRAEMVNRSDQYAYLLSLSFGAAEYSSKTELTVDELISIADEKMYKNKAEIKKNQGPKGILK